MAQGEGVEEVMTTDVGNPNKGPPKIVELLEGCSVVLKISLKDRKAPLKINFQTFELDLSDTQSIRNLESKELAQLVSRTGYQDRLKK